MDYVQKLNDLKWKICYDAHEDGAPFILFYKEDMVLEVIESDNGYNRFSICPQRCFDKWGNSRHIQFKAMVADCISSDDTVFDDIKQHLEDAKTLCDTIPDKLFNRGIKIEL